MKIDFPQCIRFACFCREHEIEPQRLAELMGAVNRRVQAQQRIFDAEAQHAAADVLQRYEAAEQRAREAAIAKAATLGFNMVFSSIYPTLEKGEKQYQLPF